MYHVSIGQFVYLADHPLASIFVALILCNANMKKLILFLFVGILVIITYWSRPATVELNNLFLENVEALAAGEEITNVGCLGLGSVDCPIDNSKVEVVYDGYSLEDIY